MPFFRKKTKPSFSSPAFRSVEHLPSTSSRSTSAPRPDDDDSSNNSHLSISQAFPPPNQPQSQDPHQPPPRHPAHTPLQRSRTQRLLTPPDASTVVNNTSPSHLAPPQSFDADVSDQSWPSSPTDKVDAQEPRRSKRSLFSFHSSTSSSSVRDQPSLLERNRSVKVSSKRQSLQQRQQPQGLREQQQQQQPRASGDIWSRDYAVNSTEAEHRPSMPRVPDPGLAPPTRSPHPSPIPRSNTDPNLFDNVYRQPPPVENSRHAPRQLDASGPRPPSRQSLGPPSPLPPPPLQSESSSVSQLGVMSERPPGGTQPNQSHTSLQQGPSQEAGFRNNTSQQQAAPEGGRSTPTSKDKRSRDDQGEIDVRILLQKHEELQAKYSKVKRYYFERDAQVQQLQNTVAHQRMAVSRTVLDDNEYANRFGRLDGAIKDLAFSIRKDWKIIPHWLAGFVNEDAPSTGTKEMTAIGRALMSRWLVDEIFERYFHPALEPTFSQQLKSIEMTLRRQQTNACTEEDKENSIARISNWRRTTLDGLGDALHGPAADEYRLRLIDRLVDSLVATLLTNLHDPPPPGIDNGARMIVENAVGIAEKIPLESRDICVDYIYPGTPIYEVTMKIEAGVLPPLTNPSASSPPDAHAAGRSAESYQHHHSEHNNQSEENAPSGSSGEGDHDRDSSANTNIDGAAPPAAREQRMRSVFSSMMGRKSGQGPPPTGSTPTPPVSSAGESIRRGSVGGPGQGAGAGAGPGSGPGPRTGRIRLAAFVTAEVRGRGPMNVLVKAPVYPIE